MRSPCLGCTNRTVTPNCHMGCRPYQLFCMEREKIRQARGREHEIACIRIQNTQNQIDKNR